MSGVKVPDTPVGRPRSSSPPSVMLPQLWTSRPADPTWKVCVPVMTRFRTAARRETVFVAMTRTVPSIPETTSGSSPAGVHVFSVGYQNSWLDVATTVLPSCNHSCVSSLTPLPSTIPATVCGPDVPVAASVDQTESPIST